MGKLELYIADTETTGLNEVNDVVELSLFRLRDGEQATWNIRPFDFDQIEDSALKVNNITREDLQLFKPADEMLPEIENWVMDDGCSVFDRVLVGHNVEFDIKMMKSLWKKAEASDSFPFHPYGNSIDTKSLVILTDYLAGSNVNRYNLAGCVKRFGLKKRAFHGAAEDVLATRDLFLKLCSVLTGSGS